MEWSVKSLPSNPAARVRFLAGSGILIYILGLGVYVLCVLSSVVSGGGLQVLLATNFREARPCIAYMSSFGSKTALSTGIWAVSSGGRKWRAKGGGA